tara:strand:- start:2757 stop:3080 length:324 start_codon:yes stop_codon:yes gene_type:complete
MTSAQKLAAVQEVRVGLEEMGLGHFPINIVPTERKKGEIAIEVQHGATDGAFDVQNETINKFFYPSIFLHWFAGRVNYLKLTPAERAAITIHPQMWEEQFKAVKACV